MDSYFWVNAIFMGMMTLLVFRNFKNHHHILNYIPNFFLRGTWVALAMALSLILILILKNFLKTPLFAPSLSKRIALLPGVALLLFLSFAFILQMRTQTPRDATSHQTLTSGQPNIILIIADTLSRHHLSLYHYPRETTPHLNEFSKEAFVFQNCHSVADRTALSVHAILTGSAPQNSLRFGHGDQPAGKNNIFYLLSQKNYSIDSITSSPNASPRTMQLEFPIDTLEWEVPFGWPPLLGSPIILKAAQNMGIYYLLRQAYVWLTKPWFSPDKLPLAEDILEIALHRMKFRSTSLRPSLTYIHIVNTHHPYLAPEPFMGKFNASTHFRNFQSQMNFFHSLSLPHYRPKDEPTISLLKDRYDEFILYLDHQLGLFIHELKKLNLYDSSLIIFTSDHGEVFEKGVITHVNVNLKKVYDVPLLIKLPHQKTQHLITEHLTHLELKSILDELTQNKKSSRLMKKANSIY
ncbi:MAG: sulfatase-like hydrolase/transferase [Deltaproteobacteria bacterium]|nr:sulfatase-like hydrolase/transferase [Deltaproteobacteria bacterium]